MSQLTDEIITNIDIVDVISRYVPLKRAGSNFSGNCPFHNEKTPSFMVSPAKQIFKCFGCGKGGNVLTFMQEIERIDFWDAVKLLAKDANIDLKKYEYDPKKNNQNTDNKQKIKRIHKLAHEFFKNQLKQSDSAIKYLLEDRKLSLDLIDLFGIGYAPDNNYLLIQTLKDKGFNDEDILQASLAKKGQGDSYGFFKNRIMFPIYDTMQNIVGFSARIINPNDKPKYLNSSEHVAFEKSKILYGLNWAKEHIKEYDKIIVVEGQMDVIALTRLGFPIAVASSGTSLTNEHIKLLKRYTENLYFLFDNDKAGQEATIRALKIAYQNNIYPKIISLPKKYKDADDIANEIDGKEIFEDLIKLSKDGFLITLEMLKNHIDISSPIGKQKIINLMLGLVSNNDSIPMQDHYLHSLASSLGLAYEVILPQYKQYTKTDGKFEIVKMKNNKLDNKHKLYQQDRETIIASLTYNNFILKYEKELDERKSLYEFLIKIGEHKKTDIKSEDISKSLTESQLRREKELDNLNTEEKQLHMIKKTISHTIQTYIKQITKTNPEAINGIIKIKNKINWK